MTVRELWRISVFCGEIVFEDNEHSFTNPILKTDSIEMTDIVLKPNHEYYYLATREVKYFDFLFGVMRIVLKEEEKKENENN